MTEGFFGTISSHPVTRLKEILFLIDGRRIAQFACPHQLREGIVL